MSVEPEALLKYLGITYTDKSSRLSLCCPFHHDTDPSAGFYLNTGLFHCFACELTLDLTHFYAKVKEVTWGEARRELEREFGLTIERKLSVDQVYYERCRRTVERVLAAARTDLCMEAHAAFGEAADHVFAMFLRGDLTRAKLDKRLSMWYDRLADTQAKTEN